MSDAAKSEAGPTVFISYSHDSPEHKKWVGEFASKLVEKGIDVILDQWDLGFGDDVPKFMEQSVANSARVLMICTETYVHKADDGKGGVGYEAMVVTGELVTNLGTAKFIPIIRQTGGESKLPKCVGTRFYVNFSEGQNLDEEFERLLRELHKAPKLKKPALGPNPFAGEATAGTNEPKDASVSVPPTVLTEPAAIYATALDLARRNDLVVWRRLLKQVRQPLPARLLEWRQTYNNRRSMSHADLPGMVLEAATICAPLMSMALAGVESGQPKFTNQIALIDEFLSPKDWIGAGLVVVGEVPDAIVFTYQALHGAVCLETDQLPLALQLARSRVQRRYASESVVLYRDSDLIGWPDSLSAHCLPAWKFIVDLPNKWQWLLEIFGSIEDYQAALCGYYLSLNIQELTDIVASAREEILGQERFHLTVPLMNLSLPEEIRLKAYRLLLQSPESVKAIWRNAGVSDKKMATHWPTWMRLCDRWLNEVQPFRFRGKLTHETLFEDLPPS